MANNIRRGEAILSLKPNSIFILRDNVLEWLDSEQTKPTESEIDAEVTKLQTAYDAKEYQRKRKDKYDALNQFELISDDAINGTTTHKDAIVAIKAAHPKP